ncbi:ATP-grasp domain-containing protein [Halomarina salina]|uniref:ATP-grasp domain-containing protein n=1 Tax=Halomarina salina TaxID=1872699 RepID=A0ABD5RIL6_9EURY|nr:ATP-grasp domain-containing protein [Halomarina salina]
MGTPPQSSVLVLDSQAQNSLALSRTLAKKGVSVTAGGNTRYLPGMLSKFTDASYVHPNERADQAAFVDDLYDHLQRHDYDGVFAVTDLVTTVLARHKARLSETGTPIGVEDWETHLDANDKGRLFEAAEDVDVPTPATWAPDSVDDVDRVAEERTTAVVVKPRRTTTHTGDRGHSSRLSGSNYVGVDEDLVERYRHLVGDSEAFEAHPPLVQEYVDGVETMATVGLAHDGDLLTHFQHEKYRVYPPSGGIGAVRRGTWEPRMRRYTERVVEMLGWTGPLHVEWMKTADGDFYLLEVNGRYWGSLALTINSGVDVPWYHLQQLRGETPEIPPDVGYRTDVRQRKLFYTDLLWLRENFREGRYSALFPFLASFFTTREEFLSLSDPLPLLGVLPRTRNVLGGGSVR